MIDLVIVLEMHGIILSILMLITMRYRYKEGLLDKAAGFLCLAIGINCLNLLGDIAAMAYAEDTSAIGWWMVGVGNFLVFLNQYLLIVVMSTYVFYTIRRTVPQASNRLLGLIHAGTALILAGLLSNFFTDWYYYIDDRNDYHRGPLLVGVMVFCLVLILVSCLQAICYRKYLKRYEVLVICTFFGIPVIGLVIQMLFYGLSLMNAGITLAIILNAVEEMYFSYRRRKKEQETIEQNKAFLLNSQIRPHFMFNALAVIQSMIEEDPETASDAISYLADFLRKEMNLKNAQTVIPIQEELNYVKDYLYIEKLRFGEKLNIRFDIEDDLDFKLPFLTIQPLAENAVRHGLRKRIEGGSLSIGIHKQNKEYIVEVRDDGVGFDPEAPTVPSETSNGIGLINVRRRLAVMCGGVLEIHSSPGEGTCARVRIPERREEDEIPGN